MLVSEDEIKIKAKNIKTGDEFEVEGEFDGSKYVYFLMGNKGIYEITVNDGNDEGYDYPKYIMALTEPIIEIKKAHKKNL